MCALAAGLSPAQKNRAVLARAASAVLIAALGGCASTHTAATAQYMVHPIATNVRVAQAVSEVEDDGLPAQTPPAARARQLPDDPSEPYSRNYGGANPSASAAPLAQDPAPQHAPPPKIPHDLPAAFRQQLAASIASDE